MRIKVIGEARQVEFGKKYNVFGDRGVTHIATKGTHIEGSGEWSVDIALVSQDLSGGIELFARLVEDFQEEGE